MTNILYLVLLLAAASTAFGQLSTNQKIPDPNFNAKVARPAYTEKHPKVLFDEAHFNSERSSNYYKAFFDLIKNDGYAPSVNKEKFSPQTLQGYDVLVIVDAASVCA